MTQPVVSPYAQKLYADLEPYAYADEENGWALLALCQALGVPWQALDDIARDSPSGTGYSQIFDIDVCPTVFLPWLGQWVGVSVDTSLTDLQQRATVSDEGGQKRGTPGAIKAAIAKYLTGNQTVLLLETSAYHYTIVTFTSETPDPAFIGDLVQSPAVKPTGYIATYLTLPGQTWSQLIASYATWADVIAHYATWLQVIQDHV